MNETGRAGTLCLRCGAPPEGRCPASENTLHALPVPSPQGRVQTEPLLTRGGLSGRVFLVTRWRDLGAGRVESLRKVDITDQYEALRASDDAVRSTTPEEQP